MEFRKQGELSRIVGRLRLVEGRSASGSAGIDALHPADGHRAGAGVGPCPAGPPYLHEDEAREDLGRIFGTVVFQRDDQANEYFADYALQVIDGRADSGNPHGRSGWRFRNRPIVRRTAIPAAHGDIAVADVLDQVLKIGQGVIRHEEESINQIIGVSFRKRQGVPNRREMAEQRLGFVSRSGNDPIGSAIGRILDGRSRSP